MSGVSAVVVDVLLAAGVLVQAACCAGLALGAGPLDRLHYAGAASTLGPALFAVAIIIAQGWTSATVLTILTVGFVLVAGPVLAATTARVTAAHEDGDAADVQVPG